jgi:rRNA biogenesis protein RRP5
MMKRKAEMGAEPPKSRKPQTDSNPPKRQKNLKSEKPSKFEKSSKPKEDASTMLRVEEKAFPRGGSNTLSSLEHKQISIQVTRDVLFEQSGSKRPATDNLSELDGASVRSTSPKPRHKKKKKNIKEGQNGEEEKKQTRIEGLSYRRLVPGTLVLGQVTQITSKDIALALPNNLTGYVPLTEISDQLNTRINNLLEQDDSVDGEGEDFADIDLKKQFSVGQYLRAYVTKSVSEVGNSGKRRIELSLRPQLVNSGISKDELASNVLVQAAVSSVEDHGIIMDLSLDGTPIKGFVSSKNLGKMSFAEVEEGSVFLCMVLEPPVKGKVVKLTIDLAVPGDIKKHLVSAVPSVRSYVPGTAVEVLITDVLPSGIRGKIAGMVEASADLIHSGQVKYEDLLERYVPGKRIKARVISRFPDDEDQPLGISLLNHVLCLNTVYAGEDASPTNTIPISTVIDGATVTRVVPASGLFMALPGTEVLAFAHISNISEKQIEKLSTESGQYKPQSRHFGRVLGFSAMDGQYQLSLQQSVIDQQFLTIHDVKIGDVVKGTIEKLLLTEHGTNLLVKLADGIIGMVPEMHLADAHLAHPERKFREGLSVKTRVLSTDPEKRKIMLTLKKSLVNSDVQPWTTYQDIQVGAKSPGTLVKILPAGAVVQFYGKIRGFLPVAEMSEAYIEDPRQHFKVGQVVNVSVLDVEPQLERMTVSCKNFNMLEPEQLEKFQNLRPGSLVKASVAEIAPKFITCTVQDSITAILRLPQLSDGSLQKSSSMAKKLRVGQTINGLLILNRDERRRILIVSLKPSLVKAAESGTLVTSFEQLVPGTEYPGFVHNVTEREMFVEFGAGVTGLLPKAMMTDEMRSQPNYGMETGQSLTVRVFSVDKIGRKTTLTMKDHAALSKETSRNLVVLNDTNGNHSSQDFSLGKKVEATITGVRATQLNVQLTENVHGRVDGTEIFENWEDIKDRKQPLCNFRAKQTIQVRIIGIHDVKSRHFLPITHRQSAHHVYELSARSMSKDEGRFVLTMDKLMVGDKAIGIVNNHEDGSVWVNLSPSVRGRVKYTDLHSAKSTASPEEIYPVGSAIQVTVKSVDLSSSKLDLTTDLKQAKPLSLDTISTGEVYPGLITKVSDRGLDVQISDKVHGFISLTEFADDYDLANPSKFQRNELLPKVFAVLVDRANKKLAFSIRPSLLNPGSTPTPVDKHIQASSGLKVNDVVRGFIRNVSDKGLFIDLSPIVTAFVPIPDISDQYIKDWKASFTVDQLVRGKIIAIEAGSGNVKMSLKESVLEKNYIPALRFEDLKHGQVVSAKVRKVEPYGVFIVVDGSANVSGLCHKSEMADEKVEDASKLYEEGDAVKAIVLKVDNAKKRVNFGLKASYFTTAGDEESDESDLDLEVEDDEDEDMDDERDIIDAEDDDSRVGAANPSRSEFKRESNGTALTNAGFDWSGGMNGVSHDAVTELPEVEKKKKKKKAVVQEDRTGELDKYGPQANADFERLLLSQPNNANFWIQYMAFELKLGEIDKAREVAERGLKTINPRDQDEKRDLWIALINLENEFGSDENVDEVFARACGYTDKDDMHERLASILIASGKHSVSFIDSRLLLYLTKF